MEAELKQIQCDMAKLMAEVALIKRAVIKEEELTDWAKIELAEARTTGESEYLSLDDVTECLQAQ